MTLPTPPTVCTPVAGPVQIWVDTGAVNSLAFLGWSINGIAITEHQFIAPIHTDQNGGTQGPPVDYQRFGLQHKIHCEMQLFQPAVLAALEQGFNPNVSPNSVGVGMLALCGSSGFRLLLIGPNFVRNYPGPTANVIDPIEYSPIGSQASRARVTFTVNAPIGAAIFNGISV